VRVKTDARRDAIASAAWQVFRENGFERTTMAAVVARAGGSKATIYSYFASKDELFAAALEHGLEASSEEPLNQLSKRGPLADRLLHFARADLKSRLSRDMIAVERILVAEADRSHVYTKLRDKSFLRRRMIADRLELEMAEGNLRDADPLRAAIHLLALIEFDARDWLLYGDTSVTDAMLDEQIHQGIDAFLRAYAPNSEARQ
jgi:AcrR family transcriptional regulator